MAKKGSKAGDGGAHPNGRPADALGDFAEDLGSFLGGVQKRAADWLGQRQDIAKKLQQIRDTADGYLKQMGHDAQGVAQRFEKGRRGRPPGSGHTAAPPPPGSSEAPAPGAAKRYMSPEARERIAAAQRKRWAKTRRKT